MHIGQGPDREQKIKNEDAAIQDSYDAILSFGVYFRFNFTEDSYCQIEQKLTKRLFDSAIENCGNRQATHKEK